MKIAKKLSFLGVLAALALAGCGQTPTSSDSSQDSSQEASSEPQASSSAESQPVDSSSEEIIDDLPDLGEPCVAFHYHRDDDMYDGWNLWLWATGKDGKAYEFNYTDSYGKVGLYPLSTWEGAADTELNFIVRTNDWDKDPDGDRTATFSNFVADSKQTYHVYLNTGDPAIYDDPSVPLEGVVRSASFVNSSRVSITASKGISKIGIYAGEDLVEEKEYLSVKNTQIINFSTATADFEKEYSYKVTLANGNTRTGSVDMKKLYGSEDFNKVYAYDGELGAIYTKEATTFKVWSPFSSSISLRLYETGTPAYIEGGSDDVYDEIDMVKGEKGVFSATVNEDLEGKYYTYVVTNKKFTNKEIVDPYAKSAGVNGVRGMIVDFSKTNPEGWETVDYLGYDRKELVVYETHVADVTSSDTWGGTAANQKLFKGMYEEGTTYTEGDVTVSTGFDHIKELGVNAVQILPLFDQANDEVNMEFNWGYNPLNYNVVEGGYSTNPYDGYVRIREFKELVQAYKKAGIEIIMDVVYNHVNSAEGSNFDVLVPGYYFRYNGDSLSNGSGCGNETASDNYMFRKFMIDSTQFWIDEYKLDGFRFDLMGLHDIDTMNLLTEKAKEFNTNIVIYGEPWTGGTTPLSETKQAIQKNASRFVGFGQFNDQIRNALHGGVFDDTLTKLGWCDTKTKVGKTVVTTIKEGKVGATHGATTDPDKTVNYVTCHDNRTLFDRIAAAIGADGKPIYNPETDYEEMVKMIDVAEATVILSQGTAFMLAGEEFARTKGGDHNSYNSGYKVNELDYSLKIKNIELFNHIKAYIDIKEYYSNFALNAEQAKNIEVESDTNGNTIVMRISDEIGTYIVMHRNSAIQEEEMEFDLSNCVVIYDSIYGNEKVLNEHTTLGRYETLVAYK